MAPSNSLKDATGAKVKAGLDRLKDLGGSGLQAIKGIDPAATAAAVRGKRLYRRTRSAIGIDVGSRAVKAVQFGRDWWGDGAWRVIAATEFPRGDAGVAKATGTNAPTASVLRREDVGRLAGTLERQGFTGSDVVLAVPTERLTTNVLDLPPRSSQAPLEQIARMEVARAHRCAPDSFEMGSWDLPAAARAAKATPVMAVACAHADAAAVLDPFEAEGFNVRALDVRPCALARACEPMLGASGTITAILDIGWSAATLGLMYRGVVIYGRTLGDGGVSKLYQTLATRLGLETDVIDYLLAESGLGDAGTLATPVQRKAPVDAAGLIAAHFEAAVQELKVSLVYAQHQYSETAVSRVLLVGGGACIRGVAAHFSGALRIETKTVAPADVARALPSVGALSASPALTLALGLAQFPEGDLA